MASDNKVEITTKSGRIIRVMPHLLKDLAKFEASPKRPEVRNIPKELLNIPGNSLLPPMQESKHEIIPASDPAEKKTRKAPVRTKSKK